MPNHCENDLYIVGNTPKVSEVVLAIGGTIESPSIDFNKILPYPQKFAEMDKDYPDYTEEDFSEKLKAYKEKWGVDKDGFNSGGYEWCNQNWGTKWNAYGIYSHSTHTPLGYSRVRISFKTAWSPALNIIEKLAERFQDVTLSLEYFECGAEFCGGVVFKHGEIKQWESEYNGIRGG